jgi:hypothetical protein
MFEDVAHFCGGVILTMLASVVFVVLATLMVKFMIGFYVPIILFVWHLW